VTAQGGIYGRLPTRDERAAIKEATSRPKADLITSCERGGDIECRALLHKQSPFGEAGFAVPILCALMLIAWATFIRGRAQAPVLLPYANVGKRAVSVIAEAFAVVFVSNVVRIVLGPWRQYAALPVWGIVLGYTIASHALWGQNLGKLIAGIKIVRVDGSAIGWREARSAPR
jgi:hypothetical protein